jgi:anti-sigma regulatory factor (Ser/Thr protein kinase)
MGDAFTVRDERDVSEARQFVFDRCHAIGLIDLCDDAALLASEVVTNAIRHAGGSVTVRAERDGEQLVVQVLDASTNEPMVLPLDPWAEAGRGMSLVDAIASDWGVAPHPAGKVVWFRL